MPLLGQSLQTRLHDRCGRGRGFLGLLPGPLQSWAGGGHVHIPARLGYWSSTRSHPLWLWGWTYHMGLSWRWLWYHGLWLRGSGRRHSLPVQRGGRSHAGWTHRGLPVCLRVCCGRYHRTDRDWLPVLSPHNWLAILPRASSL